MARLGEGIKAFKDELIVNNRLRVERGAVLDRLQSGAKLNNWQNEFNKEDKTVTKLETELEKELEAVRAKHHKKIRHHEIIRLDYLEKINDMLLKDVKFEDTEALKNEIAILDEKIEVSDNLITEMKNA